MAVELAVSFAEIGIPVFDACRNVIGEPPILGPSKPCACANCGAAAIDAKASAEK